jgi:hypothetical protein
VKLRSFGYWESLSWLLGTFEFVRFDCRRSCCLLAFWLSRSGKDDPAQSLRAREGWFDSVAFFNARSLNEIVSRPQADRIVIDNGRRSSARTPDYSELWDNEMI